MSTRSVSFRLDDVRGRRPLIFIFAPSERSPSFESQLSLIEEEQVARRARAMLAIVLDEGTSTIDGDRLDEPSADELRTTFGVGPDDFLIILVGADGRERHRDDAPLQPAVIVERLSDGALGGAC